jgi:hypothetical protein
MAALAQPLISGPPGPKLVPRPKSPQAVVLAGQVVPPPQAVVTEGQLASPQPAILEGQARRVRVQIRPGGGRPSHILLGTINHADFRVVKPIPLHIEVRGKQVNAVWRQIDEFGTGKTTSTACDDLGHTVAELYSSLKADEGRLGPDLARVWGILQEHVNRVERRA